MKSCLHVVAGSGLLAVAAAFAWSPVAQAELSAKSYIREGLVGHWDGEFNAGYEVPHADSAGTWVELTGKSPDIPVPQGASFGEKHLTTVREYGSIPATATAILGAVVNTNYTVEIAYDMTAITAAGNTFMFLLGRDDYWAGAYNDTDVGFSPIHNRWGNGLSRSVGVEPNNGGPHSFSCAQLKSEIWVRADGTNTYATGMSDAEAPLSLDHGFRFNRSWSEGVGMNGRYHSLRFYDRKLSDDEVLVNLAVDRVRFFGWEPTRMKLPDGWRFNADDGIALEITSTVSTLDLTRGLVAVAGANASESVLVWIDHDGPTKIAVSAVPAEGYKFNCWVGAVDPADARIQEGEIRVSGPVAARFGKIGTVLIVR